MRLQIGDCDIHFQIPSQCGKSLKETALLINGRADPASPPFSILRRGRRAGAPKLREDAQISVQLFSIAAGLYALRQIACFIIKR